MHLSYHTQYILVEKLLPLIGIATSIALPLAPVATTAQIQAPPMEGVGLWLWSGIGALAIVLLVINVVLGVQKLFGRTPPLSDTLGALATLKHVDQLELKVIDLKNEGHTRSRGLEEQIAKLRHDLHDEWQATRNKEQDRREMFAEQLAAVGKEMAGMRERTGAQHSAIERKVDTFDNKLDRLIERLSAAPQPPRKAA